jgi:hypothetical protein
MRIVILLTLCVSFFSCKEDHYPETQPTLEGSWKRLMPFGPDWKYHFDGGFMRQTLQEFGATVSDLEYPYATKADTVVIGGDLNDPARTWKVAFVGDSVLEVHNITPGVIFGELFWLRKIPD